MTEKILIVDDDNEFREEFKYGLEGYDVLEAGSGEEAIKILKSPNEIDLVILDEKMPGLNGTQVLKFIKSADPDMGVIMLTGFGSKDTVVAALRGKADEYLEKPIDIEKAKRVIESILESRQTDKKPGEEDVSDKIGSVKRFVLRNCFKNVSLADAASSVFMSPKYLSRLFKKNARIGFARFKLNVKMDKAKELLTGTGFTVNQVSEKLGFQNPESFMRIFKKVVRMTPTDYRKKSKSSKGKGKGSGKKKLKKAVKRK